MLFIFSTTVLIRHLLQLKTVVFLHWCLICVVILNSASNTINWNTFPVVPSVINGNLKNVLFHYKHPSVFVLLHLATMKSFITLTLGISVLKQYCSNLPLYLTILVVKMHMYLNKPFVLKIQRFLHERTKDRLRKLSL
jgi:hypothetical protein